MSEYTFDVVVSGNLSVTIEAANRKEAEAKMGDFSVTVYCGNGASGGLIGPSEYSGCDASYDFDDAWIESFEITDWPDEDNDEGN